MSVKVSPKYQVVIPEEVRKALHLTPGMAVDVIAKGGIAYIVPVRSMKTLSERYAPYFGAEDRKSIRDKKDRKL